MDTAQWPQEMVVKPLEEIVTNTCSKPQQLQPPQPQQQPAAGAAAGERKARPEKDQAINCPRCNSTNTKFCYYNNYSLTQPRYFCKGCRRYWTEGGSLRNIPVGGGSRKNKRSHSNSISSSDIINNHSDSTQPATKRHLSDHHHHLMSMSQQGLTSQNPKFLETTQQDLNLGFTPHGLIRTNFTDLIHNIGNNNNNNNNNVNNVNKNNNNNNPLVVSSCSAMATSSLDLIRNNSNNGNPSNSSFMGFPVHNQDPTSGGFSMQDHYKPCNTNTTLLGFSLDHHHNNGFHGGFQGGEGGDDGNGRHLFPFEDLKLPVSSSSASINVDINDHQKRGGSGDAAASSGGYWTGMLSGGSWC